MTELRLDHARILHPVTLDSIVYGGIAVAALLVLVMCVIVVFRARFCSPVVLLLVAAISVGNFGLLLSGLQRLAQHDDLTIGVTPIIVGQLIGMFALGWIIADVWQNRSTWRRDR